MIRKNTKTIMVGEVPVGGTSPISVQSMTNTKTNDYISTVEQILRLQASGCDIVRVAVPDIEAANAIDKIKSKIKIPLVADIHFDYKLALICMENGVDKIRINPGNIGSEERIAQVVKKARERNIPIRIGVNGGSLEKIYLQKYGHITPEALVDSATGHINILHKYDFDNIIVSLKTSNVLDNIATYKLFAEKYTYPLHLGVTEAGTIFAGTIKSAIGIGALLLEGIGDTLRVSITGDPVPEIKIGIQILKSLGIRNHGVEIISCPTCGRCNVDLISLATKVEDALRYINEPIKVAVMGCAVNGPGEAKEADFGVACGTGEGLLFKKGQIVKKVPEHMIISELIGLIKS